MNLTPDQLTYTDLVCSGYTDLVCSGYSDPQIAVEMEVDLNHVKHLEREVCKLYGVPNRFKLAQLIHEQVLEEMK